MPNPAQYVRKLNESVRLIDEIVKVGSYALAKFLESECELVIFAYVNYLERFTYNLEAISILLKQYKNKTQFETAIGLIIRAGLIDFLTIAYLASYRADIKSKDDIVGEEIFYKQFDSLMCDHLNNTFKFLKLSKDLKVITENEYRDAIENCMISYKFLFVNQDANYDKPEINLISKNFKSPTDYYRRVHDHPATKAYSGVYDFYTYYSKYEHFGIMTHFLQRQGVANDIARMIESMKYMIVGMTVCFEYLTNPNQDLQTEISELAQLQIEFCNL